MKPFIITSFIIALLFMSMVANSLASISSDIKFIRIEMEQKK
jgi:amino acid transporter